MPDEFDDLLEDEAVLTERSEAENQRTHHVSQPTRGAQKPGGPTDPRGAASRSVNTESERAGVPPESATGMPRDAGRRRSSAKPVASSRSATSFVEERKGGSGKCTAYAPRGTKCKFCGKVH